MPRTRITDDQILDQSLITELELNEFFSTVVITGTEDISQVIQSFDQYFPGRNLITAGTNITVITGSNFVQVSSSAAAADSKAIVGDSFITVTTGSNTINLSADAIIGGTGISVSSGTNSITITNTGGSGSAPNAIVGISGNTTVISGSSTTTISGVVTVTSGIAYINDVTRGGKALSASRESLTFGFDGNVDNAYLRIGIVSNTNAGHPLYRPATITAMSGRYSSGAASKSFEIRKNGAVTSLKSFTLNLSTAFLSDTEDIDLNQGDYLQVFATAAGGGAGDVLVSIEIAWRLV